MSGTQNQVRQTAFTAIVGPTAVGKSDYALGLAKQLLDQGALGVDIISVDSKQVYKGLEILTGADVPSAFEHFDQIGLYNQPESYATYKMLPPFYTNKMRTIFIHGISIIQPHEDWSLAHFQQFALRVLSATHHAHRTVIFVGGTGLYYAHLFSGDPMLRVGPDAQLRQELESLPVFELQERVQREAKDQFEALNNSDQHNPRRLIRILEKIKYTKLVGQSELLHQSLYPVTTDFLIKYLGLSDSLPNLQTKITLRVQKRFDGGAQEEVKRLINLTPAPTPQVLATLGVSQVRSYLDGSISEAECIKLWALNEFQYAKRQLTWWKKHDVEWLS